MMSPVTSLCLQAAALCGSCRFAAANLCEYLRSLSMVRLKSLASVGFLAVLEWLNSFKVP